MENVTSVPVSRGQKKRWKAERAVKREGQNWASGAPTTRSMRDAGALGLGRGRNEWGKACDPRATGREVKLKGVSQIWR